MAGGSMGPAGVSKERAHEYKGRVTAYVVVACLVAAIGGSLFGYDIGISVVGEIVDEIVEVVDESEQAGGLSMAFAIDAVDFIPRLH